MRWNPGIIHLILILQLLVGVPGGPSVSRVAKSIRDDCKDIDEELYRRLHVLHEPFILLDKATQETIDELESLRIKTGANAWHCHFDIRMTRNQKVTDLKLPPYIRDLILEENESLRSITIPDVVDGKKIIITKNNRLNPQILKEIKEKFCVGSSRECQIQNDNECWFRWRRAREASELDHCTIFTSDLELQGIEGDISSKWKKIKCLKIMDTQLTNLNFLDEIESIDCKEKNGLVIIHNSKLCISYGKAKELQKKLPGSVIKHNHSPRCGVLPCSFEEYKEARANQEEYACNLIDGDAEIDCSKNNEKRHRFRYSLIMKGTLTLKGCDSRQALEWIEYFKEIDGGQGAAVVLVNPTDQLSFLITERIKTELKGSKLFRVESKEKFSFLDAARLQRTFGKDIEFSNVEPEPTGEGVCVLIEAVVELKGCKVVHGDLFVDFRTKEVNPELEEVKGCVHLSQANMQNYDFLKNLKTGDKCSSGYRSNYVGEIPCIPLDARRSINSDLLSIIYDPSHGNNFKCDCFYNSPDKEIPGNCTLIDGDLIVDEGTKTVPRGIEEVVGCIRVSKNTSTDLGFLKDIKIFNDNCLYRQKQSAIEVECIPPSILDFILPGLLKTVVSSVATPRQECGECKGGKAEDINPDCKSVFGDVLVQGAKDGDVEKTMSKVEEIYGRLIIVDNEAGKIEFPALRRISLSGRQEVPLEISNNTELVTLEIPLLESISIDGSSTGRTLIRIEENAKWNASDSIQRRLEAVAPGGCSNVENSGCVFIEAKVKAIDVAYLSNLGFIEEDKIVLNKATQIELDDLAHYVKDQGKNAWHRSFEIVMSGNSEVTNLKLPQNIFGITVTNNRKLAQIEAPEFVKGTAVITGNNELNKNPQILKNFTERFCSDGENTENTFKSCLIQKEDECWFGHDVEDAKELDGCSTVTSHLNLLNTEGDTSAELRNIQCLSMKNTKMTNLNFMKNLEMVDCNEEDGLIIEDNERLCLSYTEAKHVFRNPIDGFSIIRNYNKEACQSLRCSFSDFKEAVLNEEGACNGVEDDIILKCSDETDEKTNTTENSNMTRVEYVVPVLNGTLTLEGCSTEQILDRMEQFEIIDAGENEALTLKDPTDNLKNFRNYSTKLVGARLLKVDSDNEFTFIDAMRVKIAVVTEEEFFDKVEFVKMAKKPDGGCLAAKPTIKLPDDCKIVVGDLLLNHLTESVNPGLEEIQGCLQMISVDMKNYDFLRNVKVGSECLFKTGKTEIKDNLCIPLEVRRSINQELLELITKPESNNNAHCECFYNSPVLEVPEKCKVIDGDLIVSIKANTIPSTIEEVVGCVRVFNDSGADMSFLGGIKAFREQCLYSDDHTEIDAECIPPSVLNAMAPDLSSKIPQEAKTPPRQKCGECPGGNVLEIASNCKTVIGDVNVQGVKDSSEVEMAMNSVEEIVGRLLIQNNDVEKIVFPALKKITLVGRQDAPLDIVDNKNLISVDLPALESVTVDGSKDGTLIRIEKNPKWNPSKPMLDKLTSVAGDCSEAKGSGCFLKQVKGDAKTPDGKNKDSEEEEGESNTLVIVLSVVGVVVVLALVVGGVVGVYFYFRRRKNKNKPDEKKIDVIAKERVSRGNLNKKPKNDPKPQDEKKKEGEKKDASPATVEGQDPAPPDAVEPAADASALRSTVAEGACAGAPRPPEPS